jgi:hypothetical protein
MPRTESRLDRIERILERLAQQELAFREEQQRLWARLESRFADAAVRLAILRAPLDDESYTEDQQRQDAEARAAIARGEGTPHEDVLREFGLL